MAITTLAQVLSGIQQVQPYLKVATPATVSTRPQSLWGLAGQPGAGGFNSTLNGAIYSSTGALVAGQIPHFDPGGGVNSYLARLQLVAGTSVSGVFLLCDRLWDNGGITITSTSLQTIASPTWPARDNTGTTNGAGVLLGVEVSAATGAGTPTLTLGYTNSAGTASRTGTNIDATVASSAAGAFYRISLQAGDVGVRSVQSITLSATWTSGTINVVAYRVLAMVETITPTVQSAVDSITAILPQYFNGFVPFIIFVTTSATNVTAIGHYLETQG